METNSFLSLLKGIKKSGPASWTALCPSHPDKQRSLSVSVGQAGVLVKCFAGCDPKSITDALGLELRDLFFDNGGRGSHDSPASRPSIPSTKATRRKPVTVCELAAHKKLPEDFLRDTFKMADSADGVVIPYFNHNGSVFRDRLRTTLKAGDGSRWLAGAGQTVYGLHLLDKARQAGYAVFVEGESDTWTAHYHGFPALGIPGADGVKVVKLEHLEGLTRIYYVREPDKGGDTFAVKLPAHLRAIGYTGAILEIRLPEETKDLSELHLKRGDEFKTILSALFESAAAAAGNHAELDETDWPAPVLLDSPTLPPIPLESLTGWTGDMIRAVAEHTETPPELSAMFCLAVLGTCFQRKIIIRVKDGYHEPLNIWTLAALDSGNRKTSVMQAMTEPLIEWEREKSDAVRAERAAIESERKIIESRIQALHGQAAKAKPGDLAALKAEIAMLESSMPELPVIPRLWAQDITPEKLGQVMAEHGERIGILSDEGGLFDIMGGRYSSGIPNLDVYLQSHAGASVRVDRGSRPSVHMRHPALSIGLSPQPDVLRGLEKNPGFRGRGLLARFIYALPQSRLGYRKLETKPIPQEIRDAYRVGVRAALEIPVRVSDDGDIAPYALSLAPEGYSEWLAFSLTVEQHMRDGGRFEHIRDWAGKLPGAAARIAGLLHCAEHVHRAAWETTVTVETMTRALGLMAPLSEHALAVFNMMGADPAIEGAKRVWRWIEAGRGRSFTARDCFQALKGTFKKMEALTPALAILVERSYIFAVEVETSGPGRKPSPVYQVNPKLTEDW
ncbi:MAG: DUF3987 domain-containing protein [Nitrospinae bacterium]|nr:DUF3987 domain-containing protein [Nitrospinota bacterium]